MCKTSKLTKILSLLLVFCLIFAVSTGYSTEHAYAAVDNSTTLLTNFNNTEGRISFVINAPKGFKTYYEIKPSTTTPIANTSTILSTDYDYITGYVDNTNGTSTKRETISEDIKLYGEYIIKVGVGNYYENNSSVRQSKTFTNNLEKEMKYINRWTQSNYNFWHSDAYYFVSQTYEAYEIYGKLNSIDTLINIADRVGEFRFTAGSISSYMTYTYKDFEAVFQNLSVGEYVGYYLVQEGTTINLYLAGFTSSQELKTGDENDENDENEENKVLIKSFPLAKYYPRVC